MKQLLLRDRGWLQAFLNGILNIAGGHSSTGKGGMGSIMTPYMGRYQHELTRHPPPHTHTESHTHGPLQHWQRVGSIYTFIHVFDGFWLRVPYHINQKFQQCLPCIAMASTVV